MDSQWGEISWELGINRYTVSEKEMATYASTLGLENPMDGGAWWAAVHGVAKSRT